MVRFSDQPVVTRITGVVDVAIAMVPIFFIFWHLRGLFALYAAGTVFARENAIHLKRIGIRLIVYPFAKFAANMLFRMAGGLDHAWFHMMGLQALVLGLIVVAIAQVMEFGHEIEQGKELVHLMTIVVRLDVMLAKRQVRSNVLARAIGITDFEPLVAQIRQGTRLPVLDVRRHLPFSRLPAGRHSRISTGRKEFTSAKRKLAKKENPMTRFRNALCAMVLCACCLLIDEARLVEMRESVKIIQQVLDGMPEGPVKADAPKIVLPDREKMKTQMEALIHHFKIVTEGFEVPAGEVYQRIEAGHGQTGYYVVSDGRRSPIGCICGIHRLRRCRRWRRCARGGCWRMWWR